MNRKGSKVSPGLLWVSIAILLGGVIYFGYFFWQDFQTKSASVNEALSQDFASPSPKTDQTLSFKNFKNEIYGFNLQYPGKWTYSEVSYKAGEVPDQVVYSLGFEDNMATPLNIAVSDILSKPVLVAPNGMDLAPDQVKGFDLKIGGQPAKKYANDVWVISYKSRIYTLIGDPNYLADLDKIVSSFKFEDTSLPKPSISPVSVADLRYENTNYGFRLQLPNDNWKNYQIIESKPADNIATAFLYIAVPTINKNWLEGSGKPGFASPATVGVYTKDQWEKAKEYPGGGMVGQNDKYIFMLTGSPDLPDDLVNKDFDIKSIRDSFKVE